MGRKLHLALRMFPREKKRIILKTHADECLTLLTQQCSISGHILMFLYQLSGK
jgi:hypothetical protein